MKYATEIKNESSGSLSQQEQKAFIQILSGYHKLPGERQYRSTEQDIGIDIVKKSLARNSYIEIKVMLHFNNNALAETNVIGPSGPLSSHFKSLMFTCIYILELKAPLLIHHHCLRVFANF